MINKSLTISNSRSIRESTSNIREDLRSSSGQVMLLTVMLLSGAILGATSLAGLLVLHQLRQAADINGSTRSIFAADSGLECALFKRYQDSGKDCGEVQPVELGNGSSFKTIDSGESIKSVGRAGRTSRALELVGF